MSTRRTPNVNCMVEMLEARELLALVTVNAGQVVRTVSSGMAAVNLAWYQSELNTTQMKQMVSATGMNLFRMPGGSSTDDGWHFNSPPPYNGYNTIPILANFVQSMNGNAIVTTNYGTGSPQESAALVAYLNAKVGDTTPIGMGEQWNATTSTWVQVNWQTAGYWASLRAAAPLAQDDGLNFLRVSHPSPWGFTYFEVGNEEYASWEVDEHGSGGDSGAPHDPATYISFASTFSTLAHQIDPSVKIGLVATLPMQYNLPDENWTPDILSQSVQHNFVPGFLVDHVYVEGLSDHDLLYSSVNSPNYYIDFGQNGSWSARASYYRNLLNQYFGASAAGVKLMVTEFNSDLSNKQSTSLVNGLWIADAVGGLQQTEYDSAVVWDLTNSYTPLSPDSSHYGWREGEDNGIISTGAAAPPTSGPYIAYPAYFAEELLGKFDQTGGKTVQASSSDANLDTFAVLEPNGHLDLLVINKSNTSTLSGTFQFTGFTPSMQAQSLQYGKAEDTAQSQTTDGHASLTSSSPTFSYNNGSYTLSFPSYSMTLLDLTPLPPPTVTNVVVSGTGWSPSFLSYLQTLNPNNIGGYSIPVGSSAQLSALPWTNINQISITFSQNVTVMPGELQLAGVNVANYSISGLAYVPATHTATWTLSQNISADKLLIDLSDAVVNLANENLAGSWTDSSSSYPSGTGGTAANFLFRFNVLPGDEDQSGTVNILDTTKTLNRQASSTSNPASYLIFADINGDSVINILDTVGVQARQASSLPSGSPIVPAVLISKTLLAPATANLSSSKATSAFSNNQIGSDSFSQLLDPKDRVELLSA